MLLRELTVSVKDIAENANVLSVIGHEKSCRNELSNLRDLLNNELEIANENPIEPVPASGQ